MKSLLLVSTQFVCLGVLATTSSLNLNLLSMSLIFAAAILMAWAIITMNKSKLRIFPQPARDASLITSGPYRWIRHPMYTGLIVGAAAFVVSDLRILTFVTWLVLTAVLILKLRYEESMLQDKFAGYKEYQQSSYRLVPFIF